MARKEKVVVAKRGCTCCGTGCVIALPVVSVGTLLVWESLGVLAAVLLWPAVVAGAHGVRLARRRR